MSRYLAATIDVPAGDSIPFPNTAVPMDPTEFAVSGGNDIIFIFVPGVYEVIFGFASDTATARAAAFVNSVQLPSTILTSDIDLTSIASMFNAPLAGTAIEIRNTAAVPIQLVSGAGGEVSAFITLKRLGPPRP